MPLDAFGNEITVVTVPPVRTNNQIQELLRALEVRPFHAAPQPLAQTINEFQEEAATLTIDNIRDAFAPNDVHEDIVLKQAKPRLHGLEEGVTQEHPIVFLDNLAKELNINQFTFARYASYLKKKNNTYEEPTPEIRSTFNNQDPRGGGSLINKFLEFIKDEEIVANREDVAIQSLVKVGEDYFHIPMIDFLGKDLNLIKQSLDFSSDLLGMDRDDFELYFTGNSYHAYGRLLVPEDEWLDFSSTLLLIKHPKEKKRIVDSRWVAHSQLKRGFSLRLTKVGKKTLPALVK